MIDQTIPHVIQFTSGAAPAGAIDFGGSGLDKHYSAVVSTPNALWVVVHNLGKEPAISVTDLSGKVITADIIYDNQNQCSIRFNQPTVGIVHCN